MTRPRERALAVLGAAAPGALAGAHLAALLWFLNPDLPLARERILATMIVYGAVVGGVSLAILLPLGLGRRPAVLLRILPWAASAVLLASAGLYALQASHFAYYLPGGINTRLLKAAFWLVLGGVVALYTALVHGWSRRRYGPRSRFGLWFLALASLFVVVERREAYRPRPEPTPASAVGRPRPLSLIVVGLDGASPEVVLPLAEQGRLPFFDRMVREGAFARLRPLKPAREGPAWTTLATGKYPFRHGIVSDKVHPRGIPWAGGALELLPVGVGFRAWAPVGPDRPPTVTVRRARPLWEILPRLGVSVGVVGWPLVTPTAVELAFAFDDRFFVAGRDRWIPAELERVGRLFRLDPQEIDPGILATFPEVARPALLPVLGEDLWRSSLALTLARQRGPVSTVLLRIPGLEETSRHHYRGYLAHTLEGRGGPEAKISADVLAAHYQVVDDLLARAWLEVGVGPKILVVVAPWGPREGTSAFEPEPRSDGIFLAFGEGVRSGVFLHDMGGEDVVPTLLYALGLPQARDLDGQAATEALEPGLLVRQPLAFVPSYDTLSARD